MPSGPAGTDHRENLFEIFVLLWQLPLQMERRVLDGLCVRRKNVGRDSHIRLKRHRPSPGLWPAGKFPHAKGATAAKVSGSVP